jgi:hypothetical protein
MSPQWPHVKIYFVQAVAGPRTEFEIGRRLAWELRQQSARKAVINPGGASLIGGRGFRAQKSGLEEL